MEDVAPHVLRFQQPLLHQIPGKSPQTSAIAAEGRAEFISRLSTKLMTAVEGASKEQVILLVVYCDMYACMISIFMFFLIYVSGTTVFTNRLHYIQAF